MKWQQIRSHYATCFAAHQRETGATQTSVAVAGAVAQNAVSKLLGNDRKGPSVETFVGAVEGLGLSVSAFFAALEASPSRSTVPQEYDRVVERLIGLEAIVHALVSSVVSSSSETSDVVGGRVGEGGLRYADAAIRSRSPELEPGAIEALLGAAHAIAAQRANGEGVKPRGGSDGVSRGGGGAHTARDTGRRKRLKKIA
jgi:transcriptional regulator with XRE-family HTH domain